MPKSIPLIDDRIIPVSPAIALFLSYLPGIDDRQARDKSKATRWAGSKGSQRGINRALILAQLNHRLEDSAPTDRRLFRRGDVRWYARSYREWHDWDFIFMPYPTMVKAFQDLAEAGYIMARLEKDFIDPSEPVTDRRALMRVMGVYNGKVFSIDYTKLRADMAADARVQAYYAAMYPSRTSPETIPGTSDQGDQTRDHPDQTRDQGDHDPKITLIRGRDQGDHDTAITLIRHRDHPDQRSSVVDQDQQTERAESSAAADAAPRLPDSQTGAETNKRANVDAPGAAAGNGGKPLYLQLDNVQRMIYDKLVVSYNVDPKDAADIAQRCDARQIDAWIDYIRRANVPGSNMTEVRNPGGYLVRMLANPDNYPRPEKKQDAGQKFTGGRYGGEIKH